MKHLVLTVAVALVTGAAPALAQHAGHDHGKASPASASAAAAATELAEGEIRRIDAANGTVLLRHGEIRNLNMGPMTMSFKFKDPKLADGLKVGDRVRFSAEQKGEELIITQIEKAP